jgi:general secretion pathway protein C
LNLKLFGVRSDQVSGRGSAIIGLPDGTQSSYAVGEEILPGVSLAEVGTESVTISRGGAREQLFLEQGQSAPADTTSPAAAPNAAPTGGPQPLPAASGTNALLSDVQSSPQMENGKVIGISVTPRSARGPFSMSGLQPGDVVISVAGQPVTSDNFPDLIGSATARGQSVPLQVRRGNTTSAIQLRTTP